MHIDAFFQILCGDNYDHCIQLAARLSIFTQVHEQKAQYRLFITGRKPNKMHLCEMKKPNLLFNSDALLT